MGDKKTLILIDGHALAFRNFFAFERTGMQTTDHRPTWAVYGFFKSLFELLKNHKIQTDAIAVAFDVSKKTFRLEKYENYKANRLTMPDSLRSQMGLITQGLDAFNIPIYIKEGFEGDDVIGTLAHQAAQKGHKTYILTGDKDSFQLVDKEGKICVLVPSKNELVYYNWDKVFENVGVYPDQIVDYKAICGDSSDNIPGVKGVGPKTTVSLLAEYKTLDNVYENIENIKQPSLREKLVENKETAYLSQFLATIKKDVDINYDFNSACLEIPDKTRVMEFLSDLQFFAFIRKIDEIMGLFSYNPEKNCPEDEALSFKENHQQEQQSLQLGMFEAAAPAAKTPEKNIKQIENNEMLNAVKEGDLIAIYLSDKGAFLALDDKVSQFSPSDIKSIVENPKIKKAVFNIKDFLNTFKNPQNIAHDIMLSSYIKDPARKHDLINQIQSHLGVVADKDSSGLDFAHFILKLVQFYENTLDDDSKKLLCEIELPLAFVLHDMENTGVSLNVQYLKQMSEDLDKKITALGDVIYQMADVEFNINSPKQVADILFNKLEIKSKKKNKTGLSTSADVLEDLANEYEIARHILDYRQLAKLKGTYIDALPRLVGADGRVHTHFNQIVTTTGRLSSSDPNLQNIPIRTELGNKIRAAFVPKDRENALILAADYSQIELRLLAHCSADEALKQAFLSDIDIHTLTASKIFGVDVKHVTKEMRRRAKAVNFGLVYGQTRFGLAKSVGITPAEAQFFIDRYFATYPKISNYITSTLMQAHEEGCVSTIFGRRRYLKEELNSRNANIREFAERAAINAPLQGSAADLIKKAMVDLYQKLKGFKTKIIMQVHDELVLEVYKDELEEVRKLTKEAMELGQPLDVPLKVDITVGENWKE